jgi:hypothetical protein
MGLTIFFLDLIHLDIVDLKFMQTRGEKKYYITFICIIAQDIGIHICLKAKIKFLKYLNIIKIKLKINLVRK